MQDTDSCVSKDCVNTQNTEIDNCSVNAVAIEVMGTKTNVHRVRGCHKANGRSERKPEPACEFPFSLSVTDALHIQQKLDETTKLLRDLQEAQKERLSAKQPPNMICLLAPTVKELELGKSRAGHGPSFLCLRSTVTTPAVDLQQHAIRLLSGPLLRITSHVMSSPSVLHRLNLATAAQANYQAD